MSYDGNGVFLINTAGQPVIPTSVISSSDFNALTADLAAGLTDAITADGQTTTTAVIPFALGVVIGSTATITGGAGVPSASEPNGSIYLRTNGTASNTLYVRESGSWDAVGTVSGINFADAEAPSGAVNGSNVTYTLAHAPSGTSLKLYYFSSGTGAGVLWRDGTEYTLASDTITATVAPVAGDALLAYYRY